MKLNPSVWQVESPGLPGGRDYLEIIPKHQMIICVVTISCPPAQFAHYGMIYEDLGPGRIRTKLRPGSPWKVDDYQIDGQQIVWNDQSGEPRPWTRVDGDVPAVLAYRREKTISRTLEKFF